MREGRCSGCGEFVKIDSPPDGHTRTEAERGINGQIYPVPVQCGPVDPWPEEGEEERK